MILTRKHIVEGEKLPRWYYGFAYQEFFAEREAWLLIPFNYLARWWYWQKFIWDSYRKKLDPTTERLRRICNRKSYHSYIRGRLEGIYQGVKLSRMGLSDET